MDAFLLPRMASYAIIGALMLVGSRFAQRPAALETAFWVLAAALAVPLVLTRRPRFSVEVSVDRRVARVGDGVLASLTLESDRWLPLVVAGLDVTPAFEARKARPVVVELRPDRPVRLTIPLVARCRGLHSVGAPSGVAIAPDGAWAFAPRRSPQAEPNNDACCQVQPRLVPLCRWGPPRSRPFILAGDFTSPVPGRGYEFSGIRPFAAGDSPRHVHWRWTLKRDDLMVAQRLRERHATFVIFVDALVDAPAGRSSTLELTLEAAVSVAEFLLRTRHRVGVLVYGGTLGWLKPGSGALQLRRILDYLAGVRALQSYVALSLDGLPDSILPAESAVVAVSPLLDARASLALTDLRRRGHPVLLVHLNTALRLWQWASRSPQRQVALELWRLEQELAVRRLRRAGVRCVQWNGKHPLDPVLARLPRNRTGAGALWPS